jgi:hypothetical protein
MLAGTHYEFLFQSRDKGKQVTAQMPPGEGHEGGEGTGPEGAIHEPFE